MSPFRKPYQIIPRAEGEYVQGKWVDGLELEPVTILASVQPASAGDYDQMRAEPGGRRIERMVRIYTDAVLQVAGEDDTNGAILLWEGGRYLVIGVSPWRSTALAHFRYLAAQEVSNEQCS